jgi:hypothetical protein
VGIGHCVADGASFISKEHGPCDSSELSWMRWSGSFIVEVDCLNENCNTWVVVMSTCSLVAGSARGTLGECLGCLGYGVEGADCGWPHTK